MNVRDDVQADLELAIDDVVREGGLRVCKPLMRALRFQESATAYLRDDQDDVLHRIAARRVGVPFEALQEALDYARCHFPIGRPAE